ncbi:MAG: flagellar type III secretion system pore protein FliP [Myxococcaceae bacterium]|nr:flagellar type III secretion system pore protein FliP [Myxococcaceae bacterium]
MTFLVLGASDAPLQLSLGGGSSAVKLFLLLTALSFATGALIAITSFTRIIIVMSFLRQALGTPQLPPNQVVMALSLALTAFVMAPTFTKVHAEAIGPYLDDQISGKEAYERGSAPVLQFLLRQTRPDDLRLFYELSGTARPTRADDVPLTIAVPAFMVSELTTAFRMGLFLFIPLLVVDLLISAILMALGLMMVPPTLVSLPLKVGIFLLADGWHLLVQSLVRSFA